MKFTVDFNAGFAHPGMTVVKRSPRGLRGWFFQPMARKLMAPDGYVYMAAVRLLGITIGVTVTRECATPITGQSMPSSPSAPQALQAQQLPPEVLAQINKMRADHAANQSAQALGKSTTTP